MVDTYLKRKEIVYKLKANQNVIGLSTVVSVINDLFKQLNVNKDIKLTLDYEDNEVDCDLILIWEQEV
jgi:hypothetical protein